MPHIAFGVADRHYRDGDLLDLRVANGSDANGYLQLDFIDLEGTVAHLFPNASSPDGFIPAGAQRTIGATEQGECERSPFNCFVVSEPHGNNLLLAIWSETPLYDKPLRPQSESAQEYIRRLTERLQQRQRDGQSDRLEYLLLVTEP